MIRVFVETNKDLTKEISVSGHSNYAEAGSDIVCSAVSTAMYVSLGLIENLCPKYEFKSDEKQASMILKILETNEITDLIIENLISTLQGISNDYADYLEVKIRN
jgi:hypothetical protein